MKKKYVLLVAMLVTVISYAQTQYTGKVQSNTNEPLSGATVMSSQDKNFGAQTGFTGYFEISLSGEPRVVVSYLGYKNTEVVLIDGQNIIILEPSSESLDQVVVSANREQQKRSEVPGAISVIGSQTIEDSKAFGIEQLVNQVPGVFMSTSKAASNEQHFMAMRSPISTKSLFLYVEDGIPIRPTAVFNHNALLEMNNTAFQRIEVLKGPASSIYGSEAIGGSINVITKNPTRKLTGGIGFQINDLGLTRYEAEFSKYVSDDFGIYFGAHFAQRADGLIEHSDYEKTAITLKTVYDINNKTKWTNAFDLIDYRSDMTGSLSEDDYYGGNFESDQTFTERDALAFRFRSTLETRWNDRNKTTFNAVFRNNKMDQNPSYRVRQFREQGQLTGFGSGEINSNEFNSALALVQHKKDFNFMNSSLVVGASADFSPQDYVARPTSIIVDPETGRNIDFTVLNEFILNYEADIFNYAGYFQYEISPLDALKITAALRYDRFTYDYDNRDDGETGAADTKTEYDNLAPKFGINYNFSKKAGVYANYSQGFTPPQTSTLFRNSFVGVGGEVFDLKPSDYNNYEVGGYFTILDKVTLDGAVYVLDGKNTLVTLRDENDEFFNANAGETRSYGIEYGVKYSPMENLSLAHNGSYAKHEYISFFDRGVDYSDTDRETAPNLLGTTILTYKPFKNFTVSAEHELVGAYNTSFEGQIENEDGTLSTATYDGHNVFNFRLSYRYKNIEIWGHALNLTDEL
ncbi:MAG: TonB-dependent receptor, partial [Bacteroidetes bacterium]|nr:TonB-dependent receptor [Bacteroidota bacterium]